MASSIDSLRSITPTEVMFTSPTWRGVYPYESPVPVAVAANVWRYAPDSERIESVDAVSSRSAAREAAGVHAKGEGWDAAVGAGVAVLRARARGGRGGEGWAGSRACAHRRC